MFIASVGSVRRYQLEAGFSLINSFLDFRGVPPACRDQMAEPNRNRTPIRLTRLGVAGAHDREREHQTPTMDRFHVGLVKHFFMVVGTLAASNPMRERDRESSAPGGLLLVDLFSLKQGQALHVFDQHLLGLIAEPPALPRSSRSSTGEVDGE
jgi:hypothetical protein